jgi:hypothetical protein
MGKAILRRRKNNNNSSSSKPQQKSPQQTLASEITNPSVLPCSSHGQRYGKQRDSYDVGCT